MSGPVILSCPFCHHKAEYRDAPPNSTVRCEECESVFRVPANALQKHRPGTVLQGEHKATAGGGKLKYVILLVILAAVAWGGWETWKILRPPQEDGDVYAKVAKFGEDTPEGKLERFLLSWKDGKMDRMMKYTTIADQAQVADNAPADARKVFEQRRKTTFENVKLKSFSPIIKVKPIGDDVREFPVDVEAEDARTKTGVSMKGHMTPHVVQERVQTPVGIKPVWGVQIDSAAPSWEN